MDVIQKHNRQPTLNLDDLIGCLTQWSKASDVYCGSALVYTSLRCAYVVKSQCDS